MKQSNNDTFYTNSVFAFNSVYFLNENIPDKLETGISFNGEIPIDEKTSIVTEKEIPQESPAETITTYQKVIEMRELTPEEKTLVAKARLQLRLIYKHIFNNSKYKLTFTLTMAFLIVINVQFDNFLGVFVNIGCMTIALGPKRVIREIKELINTPKKKQELSDYLKEHNIYKFYNQVSEDEDIQMYIKKK